MTFRASLILGVVGAAALLAAGCGGGSGEPRPSTPLSTLPASTAVPTPTAAPGPTPTSIPTPTSTPTPSGRTHFPLTIMDSGGRGVVFDAPPERIVAYDSAAVETLFAIGEGHRVVATHEFVSYPPEVADIPKAGDAFNVNIEQIVALYPDLVFIFFDRLVPDMEGAGLKVLYRKSLGSNFRQIGDDIRMWGRITGNVKGAESEAAGFETAVANIGEAMESVSGTTRVFQDVGELWTPGADTLMGEVFDLLKLENIAGDLSGYAQISPEVVVAKDPEVVITGDPEGFMSNPAFAEVSAVKNDRVFSLPDDSLSIAGPRFVKGIEGLARLAYPDLIEAP